MSDKDGPDSNHSLETNPWQEGAEHSASSLGVRFSGQKSISQLFGGADKLAEFRRGTEGLLAQQKSIQRLLGGTDKLAAFRVGAEGLLAQQKSVKSLLGLSGVDNLAALRTGAEGLLSQQTSIQRLLGGADKLAAFRLGAEGLLAQQKSVQSLLGLSGVDSLAALRRGAEGVLSQQTSIQRLLGGTDKSAAFRLGAEGLLAQQQSIRELLGNVDHLSGIRAGAAVLALRGNPTLKAVAVKALEAVDRGAVTSALEKWGWAGSFTVESVVGELVARNAEITDISIDEAEQPHIAEVVEGYLANAGSSTSEVRSGATANQSLALIPTWFLVLWLHLLASACFVLVEWDSVRANLVDINARLPQAESFSVVRNFIRTELAGKPGDVRLVTGTNVRLRDGPGMKSEVIMQLPLYSPVVVLGKEDRTWLFVSYEHEGYVIDGYVSTKFLKKVRP